MKNNSLKANPLYYSNKVYPSYKFVQEVINNSKEQDQKSTSQILSSQPVPVAYFYKQSTQKRHNQSSSQNSNGSKERLRHQTSNHSSSVTLNNQESIMQRKNQIYKDQEMQIAQYNYKPTQKLKSGFQSQNSSKSPVQQGSNQISVRKSNVVSGQAVDRRSSANQYPSTISSIRKQNIPDQSNMNEQQLILSQSLLMLQKAQQRRQHSLNSQENKSPANLIQQLKLPSDLTCQSEASQTSVVNIRDNIKQFTFKPALLSNQTKKPDLNKLFPQGSSQKSLEENNKKFILLKKVQKKSTTQSSSQNISQQPPKKLIVSTKQYNKGASTGFTTQGSGDLKSKVKKIRADSATTRSIKQEEIKHEYQNARVHSHQPSSKINLFENMKPVQVEETNISMDDDQKYKIDPKEKIVQHIQKYIKQQKKSEEIPQVQQDQIIKNLRDFLIYLETKNIINPTKLQDKQEMQNLLKDIMKLDLQKFSKPKKSSVPSSQPDSSRHHSKRKAHPSPSINTPKEKGQNKQLQLQITNQNQTRRKPTSETNQSPSNVKDDPVSHKAHTRGHQSPVNLNLKQKSLHQRQLQQFTPMQDSMKAQQARIQSQPAPKNKNSIMIDQQQVRSNSLGTKVINIQNQMAQPKQQQIDIPTIQLMINTNGQGKYLGINVNNYCIQQPLHNSVPSQPNNSPIIINENSIFQNEKSRKEVVLNDQISVERERLISYIKAHIKKHNTIPQTTLDFYQFVKLLGKGAFGKITLGIHKLTGKKVAIKSIDKAQIKDEYSRRKVFQEVYILKKIRHSCVIRLLEVFESDKHFLMVMEYSGGGDLLQYVKKRKRLNEQSAKAIFKQVLYALGHCHCRSVLHRDMKLDNVLMDGDGGVKLCDFGVSRLMKKGATVQEQCGTPAYLAPEIIIDQGYQGFSADIWSLGVLLYAMVQGTVPFKAQNIADLHKLILKGDFNFPVDTVSEEVKDLIQKMIVLKPEDRISIPHMLNHPWVCDVDKTCYSGADEDGQDLQVGTTFFRQEVMGGLIPGAQNSGNENGNINFVNIENLYYKSGDPSTIKVEEKITYSDYCALTEDFMTYRIDEEALNIVIACGYPRNLVLDSINKGEVNHATTTYYLLVYSDENQD